MSCHANVVQCQRLATPIAQCKPDRQCLVVRIESFAKLAQIVVDVPDVIQRHRFAVAVARLPQGRQSPLEILNRLLLLAHVVKYRADIHQHPGFESAVLRLYKNRQRLVEGVERLLQFAQITIDHAHGACHLSRVVDVAQRAKKFPSLTVIIQRRPILPQIFVHQTDVVQLFRLANAVPCCAFERQGLIEAIQRLLLLPESVVGSADVGQGRGFPGAVA